MQVYMRCLVTENTGIPGITLAVMLLPVAPIVFCCCATIAVPFFVVFGSSYNWDMGHTLLRYMTFKDLAATLERNHQFPVPLSWLTALLAGSFLAFPVAMLVTMFAMGLLLVFGTPVLTIMTATYLVKLAFYTLMIIIT